MKRKNRTKPKERYTIVFLTSNTTNRVRNVVYNNNEYCVNWEEILPYNPNVKYYNVSVRILSGRYINHMYSVQALFYGHINSTINGKPMNNPLGFVFPLRPKNLPNNDANFKSVLANYDEFQPYSMTRPMKNKFILGFNSFNVNTETENYPIGINEESNLGSTNQACVIYTFTPVY